MARNRLEVLRQRRDAWAREIGTNSQYAEAAPRIVAELDAEIAAWGCVPITAGMESQMRDATRATKIDRDRDTIEGDVGL